MASKVAITLFLAGFLITELNAGPTFVLNEVEYYVISNPVNGRDAAAACETKGFQLSAVTEQEANDVSDYIHAMNLPPNPEYWVGGGDGTTCNIISTWKDGGYNSDKFSARFTKKCSECCRKIVCKRDHVPPTFFFNGFMYYVISETVKGVDAVGACTALGDGYELSALTEEEANGVSDFINAMKLKPNPEYWVGGGDGTTCNIISSWEDGGYNSDKFSARFTKKCSECCRKTLCRRKIDTKVACRHERVELECEEGKQLKIYHATYGRSDNTTCPDEANEDRNLNIHGCTNTITDQVADTCGEGAKCIFRVNNRIFGEPCEKTENYMTYSYECS